LNPGQRGGVGGNMGGNARHQGALGGASGIGGGQKKPPPRYSNQAQASMSAQALANSMTQGSGTQVCHFKYSLTPRFVGLKFYCCMQKVIFKYKPK